MKFINQVRLQRGTWGSVEPLSGFEGFSRTPTTLTQEVDLGIVFTRLNIRTPFIPYISKISIRSFYYLRTCLKLRDY